MKSLRTALKVSNQKVKRMQAKIDALIAKSAIHLESEDADDMSCVVLPVATVLNFNSGLAFSYFFLG